MTHRWIKINNGKSFPNNYRKQNLYDYEEVDSLIGRLSEQKYDCHQIDEGTLGSGNWICVAPDDEHYHFIINEVYVNPWCSAHTIRRTRRLSKRNIALIAEV